MNLHRFVIPNWKQGWKFYTTWAHIVGLLFSGIGTGLALVYGSMDSIQHSLFPTWVTYLIFFLIFVGAFLGRFIKQ